MNDNFNLDGERVLIRVRMKQRDSEISRGRLIDLAVDYLWDSATAQKLTPNELLSLLTFMRDEKGQEVPNFPPGFSESVNDLGYNWWMNFPGNGNPFFYFYGDCAVRIKELVRSGEIDPEDPRLKRYNAQLESERLLEGLGD